MTTRTREAIRDILLADGDVVASVGQRIYPQRAPQGASLPRIILRQSSEEDSPTMESPREDELTNPGISVECFAATSGAALELGRAVRAKMNGARAIVGDESIRSIRILSAVESEEPITDAGEEPVFLYTLNLSVWRRTLPAGAAIL